MITLTALSTAELYRLDEALDHMDAALEGLLERGAINERDGVDLLELSDALGEELERRALQDVG